MFWLCVMVVLSMLIICEYISDCVKLKYFWQDTPSGCESCPMKEKCKECECK